MFRGCNFEYNGISSEDYNLQLYYYDRTTDTLDSGGKYEIKTDTLPQHYEQFLYGLDYSSDPLEFDIEIINPDRAIPAEQLIKIKDWLFGQDGWKTFRTKDEMQDYHLKCLLIPEEDIIDVLGYRGFKCRLRNISPFWYGKSKTISFDYNYLNDISRRQKTQYIVGNDEDGVRYWTPFEINLPDITEDYVLPEIIVQVNNRGNETSEGEGFDLGVTNYNSIQLLIDTYKNKQIVGQNGISPSYVSYTDVSSALHFSIDSVDTNQQWNISSRYLTIDRHEQGEYNDSLSVGIRGFRLNKGKNICYVTMPESINNITFIFQPIYRIGAF